MVGSSLLVGWLLSWVDYHLHETDPLKKRPAIEVSEKGSAIWGGTEEQTTPRAIKAHHLNQEVKSETRT